PTSYSQPSQSRFVVSTTPLQESSRITPNRPPVEKPRTLLQVLPQAGLSGPGRPGPHPPAMPTTHPIDDHRIERAIGEPARSVSPLSGGCVADVRLITTASGRQFVAKLAT